jgi:hypothetical protein
VPARRKIIVCRDVQFEEERALRRSRDLPAQDQQGQDSGVKIEEAQGQSTGSQSQTQGTGTGTGVEREIVGQDHQEREMMRRRSNVMQFHRSRTLGHDLSGISPQSVILDWQGFQRETSDEVNHQIDLGTWH